MSLIHKSFYWYYSISSLYLICSLLFLDEATFWIKPFLLLPLLFAAFRAQDYTGRYWLFLVLFFSWAGDVLLLFVPSNRLFFILGLSAFLAAHIFYILLFRHELKAHGFSVFVLWPALTVICLSFIAFHTILSPYLSSLQVPVIIYAIVILTMLYVAWLLHHKKQTASTLFMFIGAISFILSDFLLAVNKFRTPIPNAGFFIMSTYLFAQGAIVWGCLNDRSIRIRV